MSKTISSHRGVKSCEFHDNGYFVTLKKGWGFVGQDGKNSSFVRTVSDFKNSLPHDYGDMRGADIKQKNELLERGFEAQSASMIEFGYPDASVGLIRKHHEDWLAGKDNSSDVLYLFSVSAFEKHPQIFGYK